MLTINVIKQDKLFLLLRDPEMLSNLQKASPIVSIHLSDWHTSHFPPKLLKKTENKYDLGFYVIKQDMDIFLKTQLFHKIHISRTFSQL